VKVVDARKPQWSADDSRVQYRPSIITDRAPFWLDKDEHVTISSTHSSRQSHEWVWRRLTCVHARCKLVRHTCRWVVRSFFRSNWFKRRIFNTNVSNSCVKSWLYFRTDNISSETFVHWLSEETVRFDIEVGVYDKFAKMLTVISRRNHAKQQRQAATFYVRLTSPWHRWVCGHFLTSVPDISVLWHG